MRISDWSSDVCSSDLLGHFAADIFLRLLGAAANVRGKNDVAHTDQGAGPGFVDAFRFSGEDVQCCARQMPRSKRRMRRIDIDHCAATCVEKHGVRLHGYNGLPVDYVLGGLAARYVYSTNIGLRQQ